MEIWKPIPDYAGKYEVSNYGRIRSVSRVVNCFSDRTKEVRPHILKPYLTKNGYLMCDLGRGKPRNKVLVHRAVALAFIDNELNLSDVNHKNLIKTDNRVENLEWCTRSQNMQHAHDNGAFPPEQHRKQILCKETGEVFESSYAAAEWVNATCKKYSGVVSHISSNIRSAVRSGKMAYGFHWFHVEEQPSTTIPKGSTPKRVEMGGSV